jgi:16S rRNA processing protein RimM
MSTTEVVVGRIGKAHGVRGEVSVEPRTDEPERRFADGAVLATRTPQGEPPPADRPERLTVEASRWHTSRLLVTFAEVGDRTAAEAVRGLLLVADVDPDERPADPAEFNDHQHVGPPVFTGRDEPVGEVGEDVHGPAQDLLSVRAGDGREILVPFVAQLVPVVDVPNRRIVVEEVPGLLTPAAEDEGGGA